MIPLVSVVGKIFHKIISDRMLKYLIGNGYIDPTLQKTFFVFNDVYNVDNLVCNVVLIHFYAYRIKCLNKKCL